MPEPEAHESQTAYQDQEGGPVRQDLTGVVDVRVTRNSLAPDIVQMTTGGPQAEEDEDDDSEEDVTDSDEDDADDEN